jgi:hypothetical protein
MPINILLMEVSKEILNDIAEAGFKCFFHKDTHEIVTYLDPDGYPEMDLANWKEEIAKVKKNRKKFIEIESMNSSESFKVMEEFVYSLDNNPTKIRLLTALEGHKPFANFKHQIENSDHERQLWFAFRREKNIQWVDNQLNLKTH